MPTEAYERALAATKQLHAGNKLFSGKFLTRYLDDIRALIEQYDVTTLLDYGCGRAIKWQDGKLAQELGVKVTLYDPGVPRFQKEPVGEFDMVICTQVLGSVPISDLPWVVGRLYDRATKVVYVGERLGPVRKGLHRGMAQEGLMPHGWTHDKWVQALVDPHPRPNVVLRTTDKHANVSQLERIFPCA